MSDSRPESAAGPASLELVPLLRVQRDLYDIPAGMERFQRYLATMTGGGDDLELPLGLFNPMAKSHAAAALDRLLELDADEVARQAVAEAGDRLPATGPSLRVALVMADDHGGGWTNRYFTELRARMDCSPELRRGWIGVPLWTSESPGASEVRREVLRSVYRGRFVARHGIARTLGRLMEQEGLAGVFSGEPRPDDEGAARRAAEAIDPHRRTSDLPVILTCLYGDEAARSVGYEGRGVAPDAGWSLALREAHDRPEPPESALG